MYLWIIAIVLIVLSVVLTVVASRGASQEQSGPSKFKDFKFPIPDEGTPQAVVFGDVWTTDWQVLWYGNMRSEPIYSNGGSKK